jgi:hypothetical protein
MDKMQNTKDLCQASTTLFKISTDGMATENKTGLATVSCHVMFVDSFNTVQATDRNITHADTMDRLLKTNSNKYDDPFGNEHTYLFSHGGVVCTQTTQHQTLKHAKNTPTEQ